MSLFTNPTPQILDNNGDPSPGAKLFFFETGTSTLKTIYSDSNFTTEQSNPVVCDANGRLTSEVYLDGIYRVVGQTAEGVNIDGWDKDPVGDADTGQYGDWANDATYEVKDIAQGSDGEYYISLTAANQGNDPTGDVVNWAVLTLLHDIDQTISGNKTFADPINLNMAQPRLRFIETDASADNGAWLIDVENEGMFFQLFEDDFITTSNFMEIQRTGVVCDSIDFTTTALTFNGNTIWSSGNDGAGSGLDADTVDGVEAVAIVQTTGAQSIAGAKTFTDIPVVTSTNPSLVIKDNNSTSGIEVQGSILFRDQADTTVGFLSYDTASDSDLTLQNSITSGDIDIRPDGVAKVNGNEIFDSGNVITKFKTADETVSASTTLQDDNHFTGWSLDSDTWYVMEGIIKVNVSPIGNGYKMKLIFTNAEQIQNSSLMYDIESAGNVNEQQNDAIGGTVIIADVSDSSMRFNARFKTNASTGGTLKIQWAQVVASGATLMYAGSHLTVKKLSL